jgi:hypothetical protein
MQLKRLKATNKMRKIIWNEWKESAIYKCYSFTDQEGHRGTERPKDGGETKNILGYVGADLKALTLQSSLV